MAAHPHGYIVLTMEFRKEADVWSGVCKELGTAADGDTFEEAISNLKEMVLLHLDTLSGVGECRRFLDEHGVPILKEESMEPTSIEIPPNPEYFINRQNIPLESCANG